MSDINIYGKLVNKTTDHELAGTDQIKDPNLNKFQSEINSEKQDTLVGTGKGQNIKTINEENILGTGDIKTIGRNSINPKNKNIGEIFNTSKLPRTKLIILNPGQQLKLKFIPSDIGGLQSNNKLIGFGFCESSWILYNLYKSILNENGSLKPNTIDKLIVKLDNTSVTSGVKNPPTIMRISRNEYNQDGIETDIISNVFTSYKDYLNFDEIEFDIFLSPGLNTIRFEIPADTPIRAFGDYSHAEGFETKADGNYSHAEGGGTESIGEYSHAEGDGTISSAWASHAEGNFTKASGDYSHAEGTETMSHGVNSHAEGEGIVADNYAQHSQGRYNTKETNPSAESFNPEKTIFSVGNGTSDTARSDAIKMLGNGTTWISGIGGFTGNNSETTKSVQAVLSGCVSSIPASLPKTEVEGYANLVADIEFLKSEIKRLENEIKKK